jgi:hypothetical protein
MSFRSRAALAVSAAALVTVAAPGGAQASVLDLSAAELTNSFDQAAAASVAADPDVTCDVKAGGRDLVQHTNFVVGEVYAQDFGTAQGVCASLDTARKYTSTLRVQVEYFTATGLTTGVWAAIPGCTATSFGESRQGVAVPVPPVATCTYPGTSGYLNRYHRAHAILTPGVSGAAVRHAYSPTWFMAP